MKFYQRIIFHFIIKIALDKFRIELWLKINNYKISIQYKWTLIWNLGTIILVFILIKNTMIVKIK